MSDLLTIEQAAAWWAQQSRTPRPHKATIIRWATRGVRGRRLQAEFISGRWWVTQDALRRFHREVNESAANHSMPAGPLRAAQIAAAHKHLADLLTARPRGRRPA
jgi:hypothetical protein